MKLSNYATLTIPSESLGKSIKAKADQVLKTAMRDISIIVGGCTVIDALGSWFSEDRDAVITEKVKIVTFHYADSAEIAVATELPRIAASVGKELKQEAMAYEINGSLNIIETA